MISMEYGFACSRSHLSHIFKEVIAGPAFESPIVVILLGTPKTQGTIAATATSKKLATAQLDLAIVDALHRRSDKIPVSLRVEVVRPTTSHVDIFHVLAVLSSLDEENADFRVLC